METSSVLVTYADPSNVYPSISEFLRARLPLRNLNWNPTSRPFRSIPTLHIELLRDATSTKPLKEVEGDWAIKSEESKEEDARQARRHQIPGLRQSPYLRIYFLKCDDVDTYRATSRKDIREWINGHTPDTHKSSTANKKDDHDAFEWLVVQVTDKVAERGGTPEPSNDNKKEGASKRFSTLSRMSSRGTSTSVIEKVRSDFNGTSKNAVDRVAQLSQDGDKLGFDDLVTKMKALILASFDLRVAQYEDDIREKEMQRSLPGWNFNTFFVLKEGLARGFEAVGLLEDALTGYHELATNLNAIVEDQGDGQGAEQATAPFDEYTEELEKAYEDSIKEDLKSDHAKSRDENHLGSAILDTSRKDFRHLILANNISVFDFQCYLFARQTNLLLRLANAGKKKSTAANGQAETGSSAMAKPSDDEPENLLVLAETCQLTADFIALAATRMRIDITKSVQKLGTVNEQKTVTSGFPHSGVIDNLVSSWTMSIVESVLNATSSQTLSTQIRPLLGQLLPGKKSDVEEIQSINLVSRKHENLPNRTSSLTGASKPKTPTQENFSSISTPDGLRLLPPGTPHPGAQELAAQRGSLFLLSRRVLSTTASRVNSWQSGLAGLDSEIEDKDMADIDLDESLADPKNEESGSRSYFEQPTARGMRNESLSSALHSKQEFLRSYEELTAMALAHYVVGTRANAAEGMTADLAIVRFQLQDYKSAASYFNQLSEFYEKTRWKRLEVTMLDMYAQCLKSLGRTEDFIKTALQAIGALEVLSNTSCSLADIIDSSGSLLQPVTVSLDDHFEDVQLSPYLRHYPHHDGFQMLIELRSLFTEPFWADTIRIKITSTEADKTGEHWLSVDERQEIAPGLVKILVGTHEMHPGWYRLAGVNIHARNIVFVHDRLTKTSASFFSAGRNSGSHGKTDVAKDRFMVWARSQHLDARMVHFEAIDLRRPKSVKVEILSGWNRILSGKILIKAASAGLRLDIAEVKTIVPRDGSAAASIPISTKKYQPGTIDFGKISEDESLALQIPYSLENDLHEIAVKIQIEYKTDAGDFSYASDCKLNVNLPVSVNVQDIFKKDFLLPKFTIGTATSIPLILRSCSIDGNSNYDALSPTAVGHPTPVFARQPYSFISRIHCKRSSKENTPELSKVFQRLLHLQIEYYPFEEIVYGELEKSLSAALVSSSQQYMSRILHDALKEGIKSTYTSSQLETACLMEEVQKGSFDEFRWQTILSGLPPNDGQLLEGTLREWHKDSPTLTIIPEQYETLQIHHLTVPFDLSSTHIVHTVRLQPDEDSTNAGYGCTSIPIDQPLSMRLAISHTRQWDADSKRDSQDEALEFYYELHASPDTWLIGGQRKARFSSKEEEQHCFAVLLVPQTTGRLLYPSVEITPLSKAVSTDHENKERIQLSSETDFVSQSETVLVVPNLSSTTVSLDPANGGWLVESRSR